MEMAGIAKDSEKRGICGHPVFLVRLLVHGVALIFPSTLNLRSIPQASAVASIRGWVINQVMVGSLWGGWVPSISNTIGTSTNTRAEFYRPSIKGNVSHESNP